jgi:hypothetical protein
MVQLTLNKDKKVTETAFKDKKAFNNLESQIRGLNKIDFPSSKILKNWKKTLIL